VISVITAGQLPPTLERQLPDAREGLHHFVAYLDAVPVGSLSVSTTVFPTAEIVDHYVDEGFRNLGAGELLLEMALTWAKEEGFTAIQATIPTRDRLIKLTYESQGFKAVTLTVTRSLS